MSTTQHPLTEDRAAELWGDHAPSYLGQWRSMSNSRRAHAVSLLRAAHNAGREHEREHAAQDRTVEITDEMVEAAARATHSAAAWPSTPGIIKDCWRRYARAALSAALAAPTAEPLARTLLGVPEGYGAPHHDAGRIKPDDFVLQVDDDGFIRAGKAHYQDGDGNWRSKSGKLITRPAARADRPDAITVWPAPTPPAEEVEMPGEDGAILLDVEALDPATDDVHRSNKTVYLDGRWFGIDSHTGEEIRIWPTWIAAFTLPDGTRARRDGEREDGTPRFVKEGEK